MKSGSEATTAPGTPITEEELWSFAAAADPSLDSLLALKRKVLTDIRALEILDRRIGALGAAEATSGDDAHRTRGLALWMRASYSDAWPHLSKLRPKGALTYCQAECLLKGEVALDGGRPKRQPARALALLKEETSQAARLLRLEAFMVMDDPAGVKRELDQAGEAFRRTLHGRFHTGWLAEREGDVEEARRTYDAILEEDPAHVGALFRRALIAAFEGRTDDAMSDLQDIVDHKPFHVGALLNLGLLYEDTGDCTAAVRCYDAILDRIPGHPLATLYRADAISSLGMYYDEEKEKTSDRRTLILGTPITDFELSVRARNCLARMKIETLGDLISKTEQDLLSYKNFGETSLNEIKMILESQGLRLGMSGHEDPMPLRSSGSRPPLAAPPSVSDPTVLSKPISEIELPVRCRKALMQLKCATLGDVINFSEQDLLNIRNFGVTSLNEIKKKLTEHGLELRTIDD